MDQIFWNVSMQHTTPGPGNLVSYFWSVDFFPMFLTLIIYFGSQDVTNSTNYIIS